MANIKNIPENMMSELDSGDSPLSTIYKILDVPNVDPLEVNRLNPQSCSI